MANRFWVGGTGTWVAGVTTHWAATSGGASGASAPTELDDVFLDANSGSGTITTNAGLASECKSLTTTGYTGILTGSAIEVSGSVTFAAVNGTIGCGLLFLASGNLTMNGKTIGGDIRVNIAGGTITLVGALVSTAELRMSKGTFNANNNNVTLNTMVALGTGTAIVLQLGTGIWTINGFGGNAWNISTPADVTITPSTSTIKMMNAATATTFAGGSKAYNALSIEGTGAAILTITGDNTFASFTITSEPRNIQFGNGSTQIVTTYSGSGTAGNLITLRSQTAGQPWYLSKASGTVTADFVTLRDSNAIGGATFNATNATDEGGNVGWTGVGGGGGGGKHRMFLIFSLLLAALVNSNMPIGNISMRKVNGLYYERASRSYRISRKASRGRRRHENRAVHCYPRRLQVLRNGGEKNFRTG